MLSRPDNALSLAAPLPWFCQWFPSAKNPLAGAAALDFPTYDASAEAQEASKKFEPLLKQVGHSQGCVQ